MILDWGDCDHRCGKCIWVFSLNQLLRKSAQQHNKREFVGLGALRSPGMMSRSPLNSNASFDTNIGWLETASTAPKVHPYGRITRKIALVQVDRQLVNMILSYGSTHFGNVSAELSSHLRRPYSIPFKILLGVLWRRQDHEYIIQYPSPSWKNCRADNFEFSYTRIRIAWILFPRE